MIFRKWINLGWLIFFWGAGLLILFILLAIIGLLIYRGGSALTAEFIFSSPRGVPLGTAGGVWPAIKGTAFLVGLALIVAGIPGIATAVYLTEYAKPSWFTNLINNTIQCMTGIPSIITGLFVYAGFVVHLGWGISLLAGGIALGIMILPVVVITTREALSSIDDHYRLVGTALGVSPGYLLIKVLLPQATPAILSGILLAAGYAAGATAPIMVTAAAISAASSGNLFEPVMALPYHLYILFNEHISLDKAYATALLLVLFLLLLNITALGLNAWKRQK